MSFVVSRADVVRARPRAYKFVYSRQTTWYVWSSAECRSLREVVTRAFALVRSSPGAPPGP